MTDILIGSLKYISDFIDHAFAEVSIVLFLLGLIFFIGGVVDKRVKERINDGKRVEKNKYSIKAIYEYIDDDGSTRQHKSSNGGTFVLKYKTGQEVKLIVCRHKTKPDDIYDAEDSTVFVVSFFCLAIGFGLIFMASNIYLSLSISTISLISILLSLALRGKNKDKSKERDKAPRVPTGQFDPSKIRPIEELAKEREERRAAKEARRNTDET